MVTKDHLQKQWTVAEIESAETVVDPLDAAPRIPFGHLNRHGRPSSSRSRAVISCGRFPRPGHRNGDVRKFGAGTSSCAVKRLDRTFLLAGCLSTKTANRGRLMLGAIIGDNVGSVSMNSITYRAKDFTPFFHPKAFFTDDDRLFIAVADALVNDKDPAATLREWCRRYWDNGGWGQGSALWIATDDMQLHTIASAMAQRCVFRRLGCWRRCVEEAIALSNRVTEVTHNHPEGMRGAAATAVAIHLARSGRTACEIRQAIAQQFQYDLTPSRDEIRPTYR